MTLPTLERATAAVAVGHIALALLTVIDRVGFGRRPQGLIPGAADHPLWVPAHIVIACAILAALTAQHLRMAALAASTGILVGWSLLMGAWAVQLNPDATWAVTALGLTLAAVSFALSGLWAERED